MNLEKHQIIDILSETIDNLKEVKSEYFSGLCPIHKEKTPSLYIDLSRNLFKCFGCGIGGTINHLLSLLGKKSHYKPNTYNKTEEKINDSDSDFEFYKNLRQKILKLILEFSKKELLSNDIYINFLKSRGMNMENIIKTELGFASSGLINYLINHGIKNYELQYFNFFKTNTKGLLYFCLYNKLIFPIYLKGEIVSFAGRNIENKVYINLPNDKFYNKSDTFYYSNLIYKKNINNEFLYLTEGYFDSISLYQQNKLNLALMGSSYSDKQINFIKENHSDKKIISCFDLDQAGIMIMLKISQDIKIDKYAYFKCKDIDEAINKKHKIKLLSRSEFLIRNYKLINHINFVYLSNQEKINMFRFLFNSRNKKQLSIFEKEDVVFLCMMILHFERRLLKLSSIYPLDIKEYQNFDVIADSFLLKKHLSHNIGKTPNINNLQHDNFIRAIRGLFIYQNKLKLISLEDNLLENHENFDKYLKIKIWLQQNERKYLQYKINKRKK